MPHVHGVAWLDKSFIEPYLVDGTKVEYSDNVVELIDKLMTCQIPKDDEDPEFAHVVTQVQKHSHTKSCLKYNGRCRFNFPKLPSDITVIAKPPPPSLSETEQKELLESASETLNKAKVFLESDKIKEDMTLDEFLAAISVPKDEYMSALRLSARGNVVVLKRKVSERFINNYNKEFLKSWNANIDIQFCYNVHAVCTYISDYVAKDDTGMTDCLKEALKKAKGDTQDNKLKALKLAYLTHRQISASEAVYRTFPSMHLKDSNVTSAFLPSGFPENRSILYKKVSENEEEIPETDQAEQEFSENLVSLPGRAGTFKKSVSMIDRYQARPQKLSQICAAQYAAVYHAVKTIPKKCRLVDGVSEVVGNNNLAGDKDFALPKYIRLNGELGFMAQRNIPCIIRLHSSKRKEGHEQYYAELLLFTPWRDEESELFRNDPEACINLYKERFQVLKTNKESIFPYSTEMEEVQQAIDDGTFDFRPAHIYDMLDGHGAQENEDDFGLGMEDDPDFIGCDPANLAKDQIVEKYQEESYKYRKIQIEEDQELLEMTRKLVPEQMMALEKVVKFSKGVVKSMKASVDYPEPLLLIIHGGAGVGKSAVIRILSKWAEKILRKAGGHPNKPRVLLTAPTGMATSLIGGITVHSAFDFKFGNQHVPLSDKKLDEYRCNLSELELIIVDEMSLLDSDMLYRIHRRLCEVFQSNDDFAGKSVILVGDLMQLPPVNGSYVFKPPKNNAFKVFHDVCPLWEKFEAIVLQHNHRQGEENKWAESLNRIRDGIITEEDRILLKSRLVTKENQPMDCCHVFYTNEEVMKHNMVMLSQVPTPEYRSLAVIRSPLGHTPQTSKKGTVDSTNFRMELIIKVGARVMLVFNVNTCDGLVNGTMGTLLDVIKKGDSIDCIVVEFDQENSGSEQREKYASVARMYPDKNATPIYRHELEYLVGTRTKSHNGRAKVIQFPLTLAYASTAHKVISIVLTKMQHILKVFLFFRCKDKL
jgi:hypothetical protein